MFKKRITVVGAGYVGMSLAVLLSQNNLVTILDVDEEKINKINKGESTIYDEKIGEFLKKDLHLQASHKSKEAYINSDIVLVTVPTDYDLETSKFDTSIVDKVVEEIYKYNKNALIVIKSTVPVGYVKQLEKKFIDASIIFSPEFLRESHAIEDNLFPSRIIIGSNKSLGKEFSDLLLDISLNKEVDVLHINSDEAEAIKLFSNTYLAMRVSFFNELDSYAMTHSLDTKRIINGVCLDSRIGDGYNNPSFGYGGYCLPKDTKQLLANYERVPQNLIQAIVSSNVTRKDFISDEILKLKPKVVGFYRLVMKEGSDNYRSSAIQGIIKRIKAKGIKVVIFEPIYEQDYFFGSQVIKELDAFLSVSDLIVSNRKYEELKEVEFKLFTRDIFENN